ncbi:MAG: cell division protein ZapA [Desulfarculaceae bacterium]|nr:cell division protein ZapA [Desulfarculaceae bacterium]MCF8049208.1 cell division protein ZapA [Desulfarculaceae bacterium]MCF8065302.1 cell division protein ZapA [Desulfarculaceae bacterium]MCF8096888.1 cell division protein ZapA [Desulfarculaceae bacterium]MCF8121667.1 cell division protein ZapA [Desulfarculaceae bacterium]
MAKPVTVEILGNEYVLRSEAGEERVREVAELLNQRLGEVQSANKTSSTLAAAVLAALNITNELLQLRDQQEKLFQEIEAKTEKLLSMIEEQKA